MSLQDEVNILKEDNKRLFKRMTNLEEAVKKLVTVYSNLVSNKQVQELIAAISDEIKENKDEIESVRQRVEILENIPDIDF